MILITIKHKEKIKNEDRIAGKFGSIYCHLYKVR